MAKALGYVYRLLFQSLNFNISVSHLSAQTSTTSTSLFILALFYFILFHKTYFIFPHISLLLCLNILQEECWRSRLSILGNRSRNIHRLAILNIHTLLATLFHLQDIQSSQASRARQTRDHLN